MNLDSLLLIFLYVYLRCSANFGLFCSTPGVDVSRVVNRSVAAYMVMTGLPLSAAEAKEAGLIVKVVEDDQLGK